MTLKARTSLAKSLKSCSTRLPLIPMSKNTVLCHSAGCWPGLGALGPRSVRVSRRAQVKNVLLVAPDVDVDVFRTDVQETTKPRPRIALFVSHDDRALKV